MTGLAGFAVLVITCNLARAKDWPSYRHDNAQSGVTAERTATPLSLRWTFQPAHEPSPAWSKPAEELPRTAFDNAYHVTAADGTVYFGSSVDNKVYALNADTGQVKWTFFTQGPVRFAPTVWKDRIYAGSDDGYVYCLNADNGRLIWKHRPGPTDEKVLGNGRMISLWPVRTSVLLDDGVAYFGAGVFPYEGIYICAVNAHDGTVVWTNDTLGDRAHELEYGGVSPQGYLLASDKILYVPSGRAMPAALDKKSGRFLYYCSPGAKVGGTWALLQEDELIAGVDHSGTPAKRAYDQKTGKSRGSPYAWFPALDLIITPDLSYSLNAHRICAIDRASYAVAEDKVNKLGEKQKKLRTSIWELRRKLTNADKQADARASGRAEAGADTRADEKTRQQLEEQIKEAAQEIARLTVEQKRLRASVCKWQYEGNDLACMIAAGDTLFAGANGLVVALDARTGEGLWHSQVAGRTCGLAVSQGNLFVSTDRGRIYCFAQGPVTEPNKVETLKEPSPYPKDPLAPIYEAAAEAIIKETGVQKGYGLVLSCGTGRLAFELAKRTELKIIGLEPDPSKVEIAKKHLDAAGLYGARVVVEPWELSSLPDYFANLIVCDAVTVSGQIADSPREVLRVLRPCGGVACFGQPAAASTVASSLDLPNLLAWLKNAGGPQPVVVRKNGIWARITRGELDGAGSWTHLYANPNNTACSDDRLVECPLGVLWFGEPGPESMVERHARATAPVSIDGRLFIQGAEVIIACDAYNGTILWEKDMPGAVRVRADVDGTNLVAAKDGLYVAAGDKCHRLDPATGDQMRVYELPPAPDGRPRRWGYLACTGDVLFGSTATPLKDRYADLWKLGVENGKWRAVDEIPPALMPLYERWTTRYPVPDEHTALAVQRDGGMWARGLVNDFTSWGSQRSPKGARTSRMACSDSIFALDAGTGKRLWVHRRAQIANITPALAGGTMFFAENTVTQEQRNNALAEKQKLIEAGKYEPGGEAGLGPDHLDVRLIVALDATTGQERWAKAVDLTGCGGDKMGLACQDGVLLCFGHFSNHDRGYFADNELTWRRITALAAETGAFLWSRPLNYLRRPLIVGDTIIIEPRACDLRTGRIKTRYHPVTGEPVPWEFYRPGHSCGVTTASSHCIFYRSYCHAIYDLEKDTGLLLFGAIRPGCWLSTIAANGLLLSPEASSGCTCSFPIKCSIALAHKARKASRQWSVFITPGDMAPARHFAVNLGAPGDMKDDNGTVWFGYPRLKTMYRRYGVEFDLHEHILDGPGYFCRDFEGVRIEGSDRPWLFTSGCLGLLKCELPLVNAAAGQTPQVYTVRLGFTAPANDRPAQRVFDLKLQGNVALEDFDILEAAGAPDKVVIKEFTGIQVKDRLILELVPKTARPTPAQAPLLNFIEAVTAPQ